MCSGEGEVDMMFDVMIRESFTSNGKQVISVFRKHDCELSNYLRTVQDSGRYIISVIPLFRKKQDNYLNEPIIDDENKEEMSMSEEEVEEYNSRSLLRKDIDPRLLKVVDSDDIVGRNIEGLLDGSKYVKSMNLSLGTIGEQLDSIGE